MKLLKSLDILSSDFRNYINGAPSRFDVRRNRIFFRIERNNLEFVNANVCSKSQNKTKEVK
jgi:hypothetical protein